MDNTQAIALYDQVKGKSIGGWKIGKLIGNGKSAIVVIGEKDGQLGAVKIFHNELIERVGKEAQLNRIEREKSLIGNHHPHLVKIFDGGGCEVTGFLYIVMEKIEANNLASMVSNLPDSAIPDLISQLAGAAHHLENLGLVHRDIKPENIVVSSDFKHAILLDFGVIRPVGQPGHTDTDHQYFIGTLQYSSPEFMKREEVDDIHGWRAITFYQLGAVLHDMLMKRPLFQEYTDPYPRLVEAIDLYAPEISSPYTRYVDLARRCLIKNPKTRLELVSWEDFSKETKIEETTSAMYQRIIQRQKTAKALRAECCLPNSEDKHLSSEALERAKLQFEKLIIECLSPDLYPVHRMRSAIEIESRKLFIEVRFAPDFERGLSAFLFVKFQVNAFYDNNEWNSFQIFTGSAISSSSEVLDRIACNRRIHFGMLEPLNASTSICDAFVRYLSMAYDAIDSIGSFPEELFVDLEHNESGEQNV